MRCRKWICLGVAWATLGFTMAGAQGQEAYAPGQVDDGASASPPPSYEIYSERNSLEARIEALEQDAKKKEAEKKKAAAAPADDHNWFCCDGKKAKEVPLRANAYKIGGRIFFDNYWFDQDDGSKAIVGDEENSTGFRAARIDVSGNLWENIEYQIELDIAAFNTTAFDIAGATSGPGVANDQETKFKNVYMQMVEIPVIKTARVGHFKEPFSLEQLTSQRYITFMERSLADGAFVPARNMGVMIGGDLGDYKDAGWWVGTFHSEDNEDPPGTSRDNKDWVVTSRVAWV